MNDLRKKLQIEIDFFKTLDVGKYGVYYNGERICFTTNSLVSYKTKENAYKAMITRGIYKFGFGMRSDLWRESVDELLESGELEIKLIQ